MGDQYTVLIEVSIVLECHFYQSIDMNKKNEMKCFSYKFWIIKHHPNSSIKKIEKTIFPQKYRVKSMRFDCFIWMQGKILCILLITFYSVQRLMMDENLEQIGFQWHFIGSTIAFMNYQCEWDGMRGEEGERDDTLKFTTYKSVHIIFSWRRPRQCLPPKIYKIISINQIWNTTIQNVRMRPELERCEIFSIWTDKK